VEEAELHEEMAKLAAVEPVFRPGDLVAGAGPGASRRRGQPLLDTRCIEGGVVGDYDVAPSDDPGGFVLVEIRCPVTSASLIPVSALIADGIGTPGSSNHCRMHPTGSWSNEST
jgi:hypothetical protein